MKVRILIFIIIAGLWLVSCSDSTKSDRNVATLHGSVYGLDQSGNLAPLGGALISVQDYYAQTLSETDGSYVLRVDLEGSEDQKKLKLMASKAGFETGLVDVVAKKDESVLVPDFTLLKIVTDTTVVDTPALSGDAAHIEVYGYHPHHIYVLGSGLVETAIIQFVVRDAQGIPVDASHRVKVSFSILEGPGGGEYVDPDTMTTRNGLVYTVLNSGIIAGPVRIQARAEVMGQTIQTTPIRLAIYGGLPDGEHFSLAADIQNVAGLIYSGILNTITAFVGDKYSNPVAPGTIVYFSSDYGIIEGSAVTDDMGRASVQFMTADPRPPAPWDSAFVHITGWTYGDTLSESTIHNRTRVLLTGQTAPIEIEPTSFTYTDVNNPVSFNYKVSDIWGRPLVANSKISVSATDGNLYGDTDIEMWDTQASGPGLTQFSFTWTPGDSLETPQVFITIKVNTPANGNGYRSLSIIGTKK